MSGAACRAVAGLVAAHMSATDMRSDAAAGAVRLTTLAGAEKAVEEAKGRSRAMVGDQLVGLVQILLRCEVTGGKLLLARGMSG